MTAYRVGTGPTYLSSLIKKNNHAGSDQISQSAAENDAATWREQLLSVDGKFRLLEITTQSPQKTPLKSKHSLTAACQSTLPH